MNAVLQRLSERLESLPTPARARILAELGSDLDSYYDYYRGRGLSDGDAREQAEAKVLATPDALQELIALHMTTHRRMLDAAAAQPVGILDRLLLAGCVVPALALAVATAIPQLLSDRLSPALIPVLACGAGVAWHVLRLGFSTAPRSSLYAGLPKLLQFGVIGALAGFIGFLVTLYRAGLAMGAAQPGDPTRLWELVAQDAAVASSGLLLAIGAGFTWFVFARRIAALDAREAQST
jgi:hypothetical protein